MKINRIWIALSILALAVLACQLPGLAPAAPAAPSLPPPTPVSKEIQAPVTVDSAGQQEALVSLYESVMPGIVSIQVVGSQGGSLGSGIVYDDQGHILTNYHVVEGAQQLEVDFTSGYKIYGTVIGTDLDSDLAIVKVNAPASELHPLPLGDSSTLQVGQTVVAIGNPFGLSGTMTTGIISALGRTLDSVREAPGTGGNFFTAGDIIQTDAAINPGNSGGPLFNLNGEVIGINRAIRTTNFTTTGEPVNSGIGFAVAINIVKRVTPSLISNGKYDYPYLGISSLPDLNLTEIVALALMSPV
jgi:2-alkenal reductase